MDVDTLTEIVTRLRDAGVVECEFDARDRLRRLVLRLPLETEMPPRPGTLFNVPPVGLTDPLPESDADREPAPKPVRKRDQLRDLITDNALPNAEESIETDPGGPIDPLLTTLHE